MKIFILSVLIFLFARPVLSEFNPQTEQTEQSVIDPLVLKNIFWEEASFTKNKEKRSPAEIKEVNDFQWQGDLAVLDEIPYSYPTKSTAQLQKKVLKER